MKLLRRVLWWQAALWFAFGVAMVGLPAVVVETFMDQPPLGQDAWLRAIGVMAIVLATLMILVANRIEDVWWWAWSFVLLQVGTAGALLLGLVGLPGGAAAWPSLVLAALNAAVGALDVVGLAKSGTERPLM